MRLDDPRLISECKKIVEQRLYDVASFADFILQTYGTGIKFVQVYDSSESNSLVRLYNLDDVVSAEERGEIEFLNKNEHLDHSNGEDWCLQFTNGITITPIKYHEVLQMMEPGEDPENMICEAKGKFRNAALALAALAGLGGSYGVLNHSPADTNTMDVMNTGMRQMVINNDKNKACVAPEYIEEPTPDAKYNNSKGIVAAEPHWKNHRIDYKDKNGDIIYSLGKGHISSRAHNPGNLVVNDNDTAKKIGAIGYYQPGIGSNKYAIFPNDKAGMTALENWWFTGNNSNMTVNQLLPKFAPAHENDLNSYFRTMRRYCVPLDKPISQFTDTEKTNLMNAVKTHEGFHRNKAAEYDKYSTKHGNK